VGLRALVVLIFVTLSLLGESFISDFEYGQMLYKNPRGVSCASCHGDLGEGSFIASYRLKDGKEKKFYGPDIRVLDLKHFKYSVKSGGKIMPKYYLTNKEVESIFKFLRVVNNYEQPKDQIVVNSDENLTVVSVDENYTLEDVNDSRGNSTILGKIFKSKEGE